MEKRNEQDGLKIIEQIMSEGLEGLLASLGKTKGNGITSRAFVLTPNGLVELDDKGKQKSKQTPNFVKTCPECEGDGYIECENCDGEGYLLTRTPLGLKNVVEECCDCTGTGDILCPSCNGSGKVDEKDPIQTKVEKEIIEQAIKQVFQNNTHDTVIGPVKLHISKVEYGEQGIYVIPEVKMGTLIGDAKIFEELNRVKEELDLPFHIDIPDAFYAVD